MGNLYVIGDIHGESGLFKSLLERIFKHKDFNEESTIVCVGDYIDRGPDSAGVIEICINMKEELGDRFICLMGNHEDMLFNDPQCAWANGVKETLQSYLYDPEDVKADFLYSSRKSLFPIKHWDFIKDLPKYAVIGNVAISHAGIDEYDLPVEEHNNDQLMWSRRLRMSSHQIYKYTVHGHTPMKEAVIGNHVAYIDTGAVFGDKFPLTCLFIPDVEDPNSDNFELIQQFRA